jgi:hypothetical protein
VYEDESPRVSPKQPREDQQVRLSIESGSSKKEKQYVINMDKIPEDLKQQIAAMVGIGDFKNVKLKALRQDEANSEEYEYYDEEDPSASRDTNRLKKSQPKRPLSSDSQNKVSKQTGEEVKGESKDEVEIGGESE